MINDLTIIIPCYNEEAYIGRTLRAILRQKECAGVKIIIADAGSTDQTVNIINSIALKFNLNVEIIKGGLPAIGRNSGAQIATTPLLLFLDADITFTHNRVIIESVNTILSGNYAVLGTTPKYKGELDLRATFIFWINGLTTWYLSKTKPFAIGGFMIIRKFIFNNLGGFDELAHQSEDWLLSRKIKPNKFKLVPKLITQDNRRFKKYGYLNMIWLVIKNWLNRNNESHFYKDQKYWHN
jgi:glycosyltransferase involved in cell wall biosynthesis